MSLVFTTAILVTGLANLIAFKEQYLCATFTSINFGWQGRGVAELQGHIPLPFGLKGGDVDDDAAPGLGAFTQADGEHIARDAKVLHGAGQGKAVGGDDANIRLDVDKALGVEVFRVDHGAVDVGEYLEFRGAADVVAITAGAVAHDFLTRGVLANLPWLEGFDHTVLLCHSANPFVAFDAHATALL